MKLGMTIGILVLSIAAVFAAGCVSPSVSPSEDLPSTQDNTPTVELNYSLERVLINMWLEEVGDPNNVMWFYHFSDTGVLLGEYPVVGKPVSMTKSNEPKTRVLSDYEGADGFEERAATKFIGYKPGTTDNANPSGTYGGDPEGYFFYTPDGALHMVHGGIFHSCTNPLVFNDAMVLTYAIDSEKKAQEEQWESDLKEYNPIVEKGKELEKRAKAEAAKENSATEEAE